MRVWFSIGLVAASLAFGEADAPVPESSALNQPLAIAAKIGLEQKLGADLPLALNFKDESGKVVQLGDYFRKGIPVLLTPVYYECPSICGMTIGGIFRGLADIGLKPGSEFNIVFYSFNPKEPPKLAAAKKRNYIKSYVNETWSPSVHFLTGDEAAIRTLSQAIGFKYEWDAGTKQFAHPSTAVIATPNGKISRYHFGVDFPSKPLRLSLVDASGNRIGSFMDHFLLYCYRYDPSSGKYGLAIMRVLRMLSGLTVIGLCSFIFILMRNKRQSLL